MGPPALLRKWRGRSSNTCPRCEPHCLHRTSVLCIPPLKSSLSSIFSRLAGSVKLGQPVLESNLVSAENSSAPHEAHLYIPFSCEFQYLPEKGCSVPFSCITRYCSGVSFPFHLSFIVLF